MQYIFLRGIIESTLQNFHCPQCQNKAIEQSVQLTGVSADGADIMIACHVCGINTLLHAEVNPIASELVSDEHGQKLIQNFIKKGANSSKELYGKGSTQTIRDEDIKKLSQDIQNANSIKDILDNNE